MSVPEAGPSGAGTVGSDAPQLGALARDATGKVGRVMAVGSRWVWLRPVGGGREWTVPEGEAEPITAGEALREPVREENRRRREGRR